MRFALDQGVTVDAQTVIRDWPRRPVCPQCRETVLICRPGGTLAHDKRQVASPKPYFRHKKQAGCWYDETK